MKKIGQRGLAYRYDDQVRRYFFRNIEDRTWNRAPANERAARPPHQPGAKRLQSSRGAGFEPAPRLPGIISIFHRYPVGRYGRKREQSAAVLRHTVGKRDRALCLRDVGEFDRRENVGEHYQPPTISFGLWVLLIRQKLAVISI